MILELKKTYRKIFPDFLSEFTKLAEGYSSILDVGCGNNSAVQYLSDDSYKVGVDAFEPSIEKSREKGIHNKYYKLDVLEIEKEFGANSFDCVVAIDLIEHLEKTDGLELLRQLESIAKKRMIIFTPAGFLPQGEYDNNPWQVHLSGWEVKEMESYGYKVIGINGWKHLRGEYAELKYKPHRFWQLFSDITQLIVKNKPEMAFQILCYKDVIN